MRRGMEVAAALLGLVALAGCGSSTSASAGSSQKLQNFTVAIAAHGELYLPLEVANKAGFFKKHGLNVTLELLSASASAAALASGTVQMYDGGAAAVQGHLAGSDVIYIGANVDRSTLVLLGQKGITTFDQLKGHSVATTSAGAFGDIALHATARQNGMVAGKDFTIVYNTSVPAALAELVTGKVTGAILTPPQTTEAEKDGYPIIIDYYKQGLLMIGPGMAVSQAYYQSHQDVLKQFIEGYLDGLQYTLSHKDYAENTDMSWSNVSKSVADRDYAQGQLIWNKNLAVQPESIQIYLDNIGTPKAKAAKASDFYDNSLINQVNATYAKKLFPGAFQ